MLSRVHESLCSQTFQDFEWLVVDDGSEDDTSEMLRRLEATTPLRMRHFHQQNQGKHVAFNTAVELAAGRFFVVVDSDDWVLGQGLETLVDAWRSIPTDSIDSYVGVAGLCERPDGRLVGSPFPSNVVDSTFVDIRVRDRVRGDKTHMVRTELLRRHPYPVYGQERFLADSFVWNRLAQEGRTRFVNRRVLVRDYQPGGLTATADRIRAHAPQGARAYYMSFVNEHPMPLKPAVRCSANYARYSAHAGVRWRDQFREIDRRIAFFLGLPLGGLLYLRDLLRGYGHQRRSGSNGN